MARNPDWPDSKVLVNGVYLEGLFSLSFTESQDKEVLYGQGAFPIDGGIQRGQRRYEGTLSIRQNDLRALELLGGGSVLNLRNVIITRVFIGEGILPSTENISGVQFSEVPKYQTCLLYTSPSPRDS